MSGQFMILPSDNPANIRLLQVPEDYRAQEAYRLVTGLIAGVEQTKPDFTWEDIADVLEEHGFTQLEFIRGPEPG